MRIKKRRFAFCLNVQGRNLLKLVCGRALIVNASLETVRDVLQKTLVILVRSRVIIHWMIKQVSIHYLDYTLGVLPMFTRDF